MDPVKRQIGQHLEFEPEWEGAFNLQLKLEDNIVLFLEWCGSDVSEFLYRSNTQKSLSIKFNYNTFLLVSLKTLFAR